MNMPITVDISSPDARQSSVDAVFDYFVSIDRVFSSFKLDSELSRINRGEISEDERSEVMKEVFRLSEETASLSGGYFSILKPDGQYDTSGLVKGWAIREAADILRQEGYEDFYVDAGGDIQISGKNAGNPWRLGIRNPFDPKKREIVDIVSGDGIGLATSGISERGKHIWNPKTGQAAESPVMSLSVIGPDIFEADRFATAAFAMGIPGITFLERFPGLEGYMIDATGIATETSGWERYRIQ